MEYTEPDRLPLPGGEVRIFEPDPDDGGRTYVLDVFGLSILVRERPDGLFIQVDKNGESPASYRRIDAPLVVEVNNGGEVRHGDNYDAGH